ncbi:hypothetical protein ACO0RG_000553 [Hanseniaspora osmophila]|uniref:Putative uridine kinase DAS2 n=1 Tax=Hanseniaspora osmophila TaxID=56408 RepID=A0A1E5R1E7_9ASCO|nr:putative uridine kinase DAS2 [Hanseniaspora osmophila]
MGRYFISIGGGHCSDIHSITFSIREKLNQIFDNNYHIRIIDLDEMRGTKPFYTEQDFDFAKIYKDLITIKTSSNKSIGTEIQTQTPTQNTDVKEIILVCGVYALYNHKINSLMNLKIFMDTDLDFRLIKLITRNRDHENESQDKMNLESSIDLYMNHLRPEWFNYVKPTRFNADMIVPLKYNFDTMIANHDKTSMLFLDGIVSLINESDAAAANGETPQSALKLGNFNIAKRRTSSIYSSETPQLSFPEDFKQECPPAKSEL